MKKINLGVIFVNILIIVTIFIGIYEIIPLLINTHHATQQKYDRIKKECILTNVNYLHSAYTYRCSNEVTFTIPGE